jgi:RecJ-like exonuclease
MSAPDCPRCKGSRRLLMATGKTRPCDCACSNCSGLGTIDGEECPACEGSGKEPRCILCDIILSVDEVSASRRNETPLLCDACGEAAESGDTMPPPAAPLTLPTIAYVDDDMEDELLEDEVYATTAMRRRA